MPKMIFILIFTALISTGCSLTKVDPVKVDNKFITDDVKIEDKVEEIVEDQDDTPEIVERDTFRDDTPLDLDGDGLSDVEEIDLGTDPNLKDTDDDGLTDKEEIDLGTNPMNSDTDGDGYSDEKEVTNGHDPLVAYFDPLLSEMIYFKDGSYYRADAKGLTHKKIFTLWEEGEDIHYKAEHFPENADKMLIMDYGKYKIDTDGPLATAGTGLKPEKIYLLDLLDNSVTGVSLSQASDGRMHSTYLLSLDGDKIIRLSDYSWPITDMASLAISPTAEIAYYDIAKKQWLIITAEQKVLRCNQTLVKDPFSNGDKWHLFYRFDWSYIRVLEEEVVKSCDLNTGEKNIQFFLSDLCIDDTPDIMSPSIYNQNFYNYGCTDKDAKVYNVTNQGITNIADFRGEGEQIGGMYEGAKYLLSPNQKYFLYGYTLLTTDDIPSTIAKSVYLYEVGNKKINIVPGANWYRPYSYDSKYIVYPEIIDEEDSDSGLIEEYWKVYNINEKEIIPIDILVYEYDRIDDYDLFGRNTFIGWIDKKVE